MVLPQACQLTPSSTFAFSRSSGVGVFFLSASQSTSHRRESGAGFGKFYKSILFRTP